jgi:hypothetical protein
VGEGTESYKIQVSYVYYHSIQERSLPVMSRGNLSVSMADKYN